MTEIIKSDLPLNALAKETLNKLASEGHKIYLLTARSEALIQYTSEWLRKKAIPYTGLFHLVGGKKYMKAITVDLVVEDSLEEALKYAKTVKHVLLFDSHGTKQKTSKTWSRESIVGPKYTQKCRR